MCTSIITILNAIVFASRLVSISLIALDALNGHPCAQFDAGQL